MRKTTPAPERFWPKVQKTETCWLWTAGLDGYGYGQFRADPKPAPPAKAHQFAYRLLVGEIGPDLQLDHLCRERRCVNPAHLQPVTSRTNTLRGQGLAARNARKTHCLRGHELPTEGNRRQGWRRCNVCRREKRRQAA